MRHLLLVLALLVADRGLSQGYKSVDEVDFGKIEKLSWEAAYRALEVKDVKTQLERILKSNSHEHETAARALVYMSDGKSYEDSLRAKFKELQTKLKRLDAAFPDSQKRGFGRQLEYGMKARQLRIAEDLLPAAALFHHADTSVLEFVLRAMGRCPTRKDAPFGREYVRLLADAIRDFAWRRIPEDDALKYLSNDDRELRLGALVFILGDPIAGDPTAPLYEPMSDAKWKKVVIQVKEHYRQERPEFVKDKQQQLAKLKKSGKNKTAAGQDMTKRESLLAAYKNATGIEKKQLALQLDKIYRIDYKKDFGYPYPGKPLDKSLVQRRLGIWLFIEKMLFNMAYVRSLPLEKRKLKENFLLSHRSKYASLGAKLGMKDEEKVVAEGWEFLTHVNAVLNGSKKELLHEDLVWDFCGIAYKFNNAAKAETIEEYLKWEGLSTFWRLYNRFELFPEKMAILTQQWAVYMARNYKIEDYIRSHVMVDIYKKRIETQAYNQFKFAKDREKRLEMLKRVYPSALHKDLDEKERVARQHLKEIEELIQGKSKYAVALKSNNPRIQLAPYTLAQHACADYVIWNAMIETKSFEDYVYLNELDRKKLWQTSKLAKERFPTLVAKYGKTYKLLLKHNPELTPPTRKNKRKP